MLNKPRNIKYSKVQRGKLPRLEMSSYNLKFGSLGLMALEKGFLNYNQLEACRKVINRTIKRKGKI